jgi:hypothetical protein
MLRRVSANFSAQLWSLTVSLADRVILVGILLRVWGADTYADWATLFAMAGLIVIGEMGLNVYFGNQWQRAFAQKNKAEFQRLIGVSLWLYAVLGGGLALLAIGIALTSFYTPLFNLNAITPQTAIIVFLLLSGMNVFRIMRGSISQIYRGRGQFAVGTVLFSVYELTSIIFIGIASLLGMGPVFAAAIYFLNFIFTGYTFLFIFIDVGRRGHNSQNYLDSSNC